MGLAEKGSNQTVSERRETLLRVQDQKHSSLGFGWVRRSSS
jgi:hypothetical protein